MVLATVDPVAYASICGDQVYVILVRTSAFLLFCLKMVERFFVSDGKSGPSGHILSWCSYEDVSKRDNERITLLNIQWTCNVTFSSRCSANWTATDAIECVGDLQLRYYTMYRIHQLIFDFLSYIPCCTSSTLSYAHGMRLSPGAIVSCSILRWATHVGLGFYVCWQVHVLLSRMWLCILLDIASVQELHYSLGPVAQ